MADVARLRHGTDFADLCGSKIGCRRAKTAPTRHDVDETSLTLRLALRNENRLNQRHEICAGYFYLSVDRFIFERGNFAADCRQTVAVHRRTHRLCRRVRQNRLHDTLKIPAELCSTPAF